MPTKEMPVQRGCQHPEFVKPITPNKARNRRPMATGIGSNVASREWEWCELCWGKVPKDAVV